MRRPSHRRYDLNYAPGPRARNRDPIPAIWILKELYPQSDGREIWERPWWAKLAYSRGWISAEEYYLDIEEEPTGRFRPGIPQLLYQSSPLFGLIKRDTSWGQP